MKIGILGGTFDPPHVGHLNISLEAIKRFQLNKVIWLITKKNPLKKKSASNDISNRIKLCNELIKKNKNIIKVEYTEEKTGSNFLFDNIDYIINKSFDHKHFFIMGADSFVKFNEWKKYNEILNKLSIIVMNRPEFSMKSLTFIPFVLKKYHLCCLSFETKFKDLYFSSFFAAIEFNDFIENSGLFITMIDSLFKISLYFFHLLNLTKLSAPIIKKCL